MTWSIEGSLSPACVRERVKSLPHASCLKSKRWPVKKEASSCTRSETASKLLDMDQSYGGWPALQHPPNFRATLKWAPKNGAKRALPVPKVGKRRSVWQTNVWICFSTKLLGYTTFLAPRPTHASRAPKWPGLEHPTLHRSSKCKLE